VPIVLRELEEPEEPLQGAAAFPAVAEPELREAERQSPNSARRSGSARWEDAMRRASSMWAGQLTGLMAQSRPSSGTTKRFSRNLSQCPLRRHRDSEKSWGVRTSW
jgi:hypothetical protein